MEKLNYSLRHPVNVSEEANRQWVIPIDTLHTNTQANSITYNEAV